jgi:hypothetical protein
MAGSNDGGPVRSSTEFFFFSQLFRHFCERIASFHVLDFLEALNPSLREVIDFYAF